MDDYWSTRSDGESILLSLNAEVDKVGRKNKFNGYERVRGVSLMLEPFTVENELLTPT